MIPERLTELAHALSLATTTDSVTATVVRLLGVLRTWNRWLLIFDNAEQPQVLTRYLPGGTGQVLITSRNPGWQDLATPLQVNLFDRGESVTLLRRRAPQLTDGEAERITQALGDLPLAIVQAGAHLVETATGVEDYLTLLNERTTELLDEGVPATYPVSLAASVQISLRSLAAHSPAALQLLTLAAYMGPEPIPLTLFTGHLAQLPSPLGTVAPDSLAFPVLPRQLCQRGLVRLEAGTIQLHRLHAAILRAQPNQHPDLPTLIVQMLANAVPDDPWDNPPAWPLWRELLPHVLAATDPNRTLTNVDEVACLLGRAATYLLTRGEPAPAQPLFERALNLRRTSLGDNHPDTFVSATDLARNLWELGCYEQARELNQDTFSRRRQNLGNDHPDTLISAHNLVHDLRALGRLEQAHKLAEDTLARRRRILGYDHLHALRSANTLASILRELGHHEQARQLAEDTLARRRRILGDDHPRTLISANSLALTLRDLGQREQARKLAEDTLSRSRRILGDDHPDTLRLTKSFTTIDEVSESAVQDAGQHPGPRHDY